jgi:hypothetical protein
MHERNEIFDESVVQVESGGFAFQRLNFSLKATVRGAPNGKLKVELRKNNKSVDW